MTRVRKSFKMYEWLLMLGRFRPWDLTPENLTGETGGCVALRLLAACAASRAWSRRTTSPARRGDGDAASLTDDAVSHDPRAKARKPSSGSGRNGFSELAGHTQTLTKLQLAKSVLPDLPDTEVPIRDIQKLAEPDPGPQIRDPQTKD